MKFLSISLLLLTLSIVGFSQSLDQVLKSISNDLAAKVTKKNKTKLALLDFVNESGRPDPMVNYLQEQIEMHLINADDLVIMDRKHIRDLLKENKLESDGLMNETLAKKAVSFIRIDGWVIAEITSLNNQFKIKLKVIDVNTSQIFAVSSTDFMSDVELRRIMEPKACYVCKGTGAIASLTTCNACAGAGGPACYSCGGAGTFYNGLTGRRQSCDTCAGKGKISCNICMGSGQKTIFNSCKKCGGKGHI